MTSRMAPFTRCASTPATSTRRSLSLVTELPSSLGEADTQLAVLHRGSHRLAPRQHARQHDLAPVVAHGDEELAILPRELDVAALDEGGLQSEDIFSVPLLDPLRAALVEASRRVPL